MKKFEIIDIAPVDGHYLRKDFIGQIGSVIEGSNFLNKSFFNCKFVFDDPLLNGGLDCVYFYRVKLRQVNEFRFQVRRALRAHK